ncbi:MAG: hypothetical protein ACI9EW_000832 [Cellvibrionaceae bacterium]|jgi:hypothetical protein
MLNREDLHFVIRVRGKGGVPSYHLILMDAMNKLFIRWSRELPQFERPSSHVESIGSPILDMTKFSHVEIFQVVDDIPNVEEVGTTLRGTLYQTRMRAWDLREQTEKEIDLSTTNEAHLLFDIDYQYDTVNLISLYNHAHGDEVVAMIIKKGTSAQILLFDFRLEAIELNRRSGRLNFVDFLQNFRNAFIHFGETHYPEGKTAELARSWRVLADQVTFEVLGGQSADNRHHLNVILRELYGLKLILAASLLDRCLPNSAEYKAAHQHLKTYLPRKKTEKRLLNLGKPEISWSQVVFGLPHLDDLFDDLQDEPARLQVKTVEPMRMVINKDDLDIPAEYRDFWDVVKINPD